jgi:hypothetical protein
MKLLGTHLGVSWRTVARWESGETKPDVKRWLAIIGFLRQYAPQQTAELAEAAGVLVPIASAELVAHAKGPSEISKAEADPQAIELALLRAADHLDVAPGRVRSALRELLVALDAARGTLADLSSALQPAQER